MDWVCFLLVVRVFGFCRDAGFIYLLNFHEARYTFIRQQDIDVTA